VQCFFFLGEQLNFDCVVRSPKFLLPLPFFHTFQEPRRQASLPSLSTQAVPGRFRSFPATLPPAFLLFFLQRTPPENTNMLAESPFSLLRLDPKCRKTQGHFLPTCSPIFHYLDFFLIYWTPRLMVLPLEPRPPTNPSIFTCKPHAHLWFENFFDFNWCPRTINLV